MFDKTHLPPALFEYVVIADTHYMIDVGDRPLEFESRRKQSQRANVALRQVAGIESQFVIHLGDLVQEYPETPDFKRAISEAHDQLQTCNIHPHHVAGNHDVGDKNDPTMPTHPTTTESLATFHDLFGPTWYSFDHNQCHFIVLNSQILNTDLPEAQEQWQWFETDLSAHKDRRIFLFFHLPLYIWDENEPGLGHYDNINLPDRKSLLVLIQNHNIEMVFAAHVHYPFYDRINNTRYFIAPSPSFTRPGFGHLYASAPPPEQGRDDTGKLGFYLLRVYPDRTDAHFVRTNGEMILPSRDRVVTCPSAALPNSPIGITLRHPITPAAELPLTYPFVVRQKVRNDQHFLACIELGVTSVRFPWRDLLDPFQRKRLEMLQSEGVSLVATFLEPRITSLPELIEANINLIQNWEIQIPGTSQPTNETLQVVKRCEDLAQLSLCPIISNERVPGKQHLRTRTGYCLDELDDLNTHLQNSDVHLNRVLCHIPPNESPWAFAQSLSAHTYTNIDHIDFSLELNSQNDCTNTHRIAESTFAIASLPKSRLFIDPLVDFDRTMDVTHGLLDTLCNPRPAFHVLRCLNTLLFSPVHSHNYTNPSTHSSNSAQILQLADQNRELVLILPPEQVTPRGTRPNAPSSCIYHLATGETESVSDDESLAIIDSFPALLISQTA